MQQLTLDIVSPHGQVVHAEGLDSVVVRRREAAFDPGSEVAICKGHAPLFMQVQPCEVRYTAAGRTETARIGRALLEVWRDHVTIALT